MKCVSSIVLLSRKLFKKLSACTLIVFFFGNQIIPQVALAGNVFPLPAAQSAIVLSLPFAPALLRAVRIFPEKPFRFNFVVDTGQEALGESKSSEESEKLIRYFLAGLTIPEEDLWVNLSPYERNRIVPDQLIQTAMGRDLLAQDYLLKQMTSSLMNPEDELGEEFWEKVYAKVYETYGKTNIPVNTFNKVWIVPDKATVHQEDNIALITESSLKVMLEEDYLAWSKSNSQAEKENDGEFCREIIKEIIVPAIEREVNEGKHFSPLRQIYSSLILASWYKETIRMSILQDAYIGQSKVKGIEIDDVDIKERIFNKYVESFKEGIFNYIKEDYDPQSQALVARKYFSGGIGLTQLKVKPNIVHGISQNILPENNGSMVEHEIQFNNSEGKEIDHALISEVGRSVKSLFKKEKLPENYQEIIANIKGSYRGAYFTDYQIQHAIEKLNGLGAAIVPELLEDVNSDDDSAYQEILRQVIKGFSKTSTPYIKKKISQGIAALNTKGGDEAYLLSYLDVLVSMISYENIREFLMGIVPNFPQAILSLNEEDRESILPQVRNILKSSLEAKKRKKIGKSLLSSIEALSRLRDESSVDDIIEIFNFSLVDDQELILKAIRGNANPKYYQIILDYLKSLTNEEYKKSSYATEALIHFRSEEGIEYLSEIPELKIYDFFRSLARGSHVETLTFIFERVTDVTLSQRAMESILKLAKTNTTAADYLRFLVHSYDLYHFLNLSNANELISALEGMDSSEDQRVGFVLGYLTRKLEGDFFLNLEEFQDKAIENLMRQLDEKDFNLALSLRKRQDEKQKFLAYSYLARINDEGKNILLQTHQKEANPLFSNFSIDSMGAFGQMSHGMSVGRKIDFRDSTVIAAGLSIEGKRDYEVVDILNQWKTVIDNRSMSDDFWDREGLWLLFEFARPEYIPRLMEMYIKWIVKGGDLDYPTIQRIKAVYYKDFHATIKKILFAENSLHSEGIIEKILPYLYINDAINLSKEIMESSLDIGFKRIAMEGLVQHAEDFNSLLSFEKTKNIKRRQILIYQIVVDIIQENKFSPGETQFYDLDILELRKKAVEALSLFEGSYSLAIKILKDESEKKEIRQAVLDNLSKYQWQAVSMEDSEPRKPTIAEQILHFPSTYRKLVDQARFNRRYANLKDSTPAGGQNSSLGLSPPSIPDPFSGGSFHQQSSQRIQIETADIFFDIDKAHAPTPKAPTKIQPNRFIEVLAENTEKSAEQIQEELRYNALKEHYRLLNTYGFIEQEDDIQSKTIYKIFERMVNSYNQMAKAVGQGEFEGKLFIVDSPEVNAFVFSRHQDVYITTGLIRELAHYAEDEDVTFHEGLIAGVFMHELTHILQDSSYEGLPLLDEVKSNQLLANEILDLKRQAEYNADEGGIMGLSLADYNPDSMLQVLHFLQRITYQTTAEAAIDSHPHPKERISHGENFIENESQVFGRWNEGYEYLDIQMFRNWKTRHLGNRAHEIYSLDDSIALLNEADNMGEVLEIVKISRYIDSHLHTRQLLQENSTHRAFAREIYMNNALALMQGLVTRALGEKNEIKLKTDISVEDNEGQLILRLTRDDNRGPRNNRFLNKLNEMLEAQTSVDNYINRFNGHVEMIRDYIIGSHLDSQRKSDALEILMEIYQEGISALQSVDEGTFNSYESSSPASQFKTMEDILDATLQGNESGLEQLRRYPYILFERFGKKTLDEEIAMEDYLAHTKGMMFSAAGIEIGELDLGKIYLERSSSNFYAKDLRLLPLESIADRQALLQALMLPYLIKNSKFNGEKDMLGPGGWSGSDYKFDVDVEDAIINAVMRLAPDAPVDMKIHSHNPDEITSYYLKNALALHLVGKLTGKGFNKGDFSDLPEDEKSRQRQFDEYMSSVIYREPEEFFSGIFDNEFKSVKVSGTTKRVDGANRLIAKHSGSLFDFKPDAEMKNFYRRAEMTENTSLIINHIKNNINHFPTENEKKDFLKGVFKKFSIYFRVDLLDAYLKDDSLKTFFSLYEFKEIMDGIFYPSEIYRYLLTFSSKYILRTDIHEMEKDMEVFDWIISNRPPAIAVLPNKFLSNYLQNRLKIIQENIRIDFEASTQRLLSSLSSNELSDLYKKYLTEDIFFEILSKLAISGNLTYKESLGKEWQIVDSENDFPASKISQGLYHSLKGYAESNINQAMEIDSSQMPIGFYGGPKIPIEQRFFRMVFDLKIDRLQYLARYQSEVRKRLIVHRGRLKKIPSANNFQEMLNALILLRALEREGLYDANITSEDFSKILKGTLSVQKVYGSHYVIVFVAVNNNNANDLSAFFKTSLKLDSLSSQARKKAFDFFLRLREEQGLIGQTSFTDSFFYELSKTPIGLFIFEIYSPFMKDVQIPEAEKEKLTASEKRRSYLTAMSEAITIEGKKSYAFKQYNLKHVNILKSKKPLAERIATLLPLLPKASLFRDMIIDKWERSLVPEMDLNALEKIGLSIARHKIKENLSDNQSLLETIALVTPLQWKKVKSAKFGESLKKADEVLDFYRRTIKLIFDPQKQLRMGAAALTIYRQAYRNPTFAEELAAIIDFFPFASKSRDQHLNELFDNHTIPSEVVSVEEIDNARKLFTAYQVMNYDEELTNASFANQMVKAIFASAAREDRVEILYWILDSKTFPMPKHIWQMHDQLNLEFKELPKHVSYLPEEFRVEIFQNMFLGENGLFSPQSERDEKLFENLIDTLFQLIFPDPESGNKRKRRSQLDPKSYKVVRRLFPRVMKLYSPARRTSIMISLLSIYDKLNNLSDGQKLAQIAPELGPVWIKLLQIFSENEKIIKDKSLREDLGSLKVDVSEIIKLAILEIFEREGYPIGTVRVGRRIGTASMGQTHQGEIQIEGKWSPVVLKVLKPKIQRTLTKDILVIKDILSEFNSEHFAHTIEKWIQIESDLRNEAKNTKTISGIVEAYYQADSQQSPEKLKGDLIIGVPKVIDSGETILIMERVDGTTVEGFFKFSIFKKIISQFGRFYKNIKKFAHLSKSWIIKKNRSFFTFSLFKKGIVHADEHRGNVMVGNIDDGDLKSYLIDFGLIQEFNQKQLPGITEAVKGIILHDSQMIFEGVKKIHAYSEGIEDGRSGEVIRQIDSKKRFIIEEIKKIFKKQQDIKTEMNEISTLIVPMNLPGSEDFSGLMKAITTGIWLFPTSILTAIPTLNHLSSELELTGSEYRHALRTHFWPVIKSSILISFSNFYQGMSYYLGRLVDPVKRLGNYLQTQISGLPLLKELAGNAGKMLSVAKHLDGEENVRNMDNQGKAEGMPRVRHNDEYKNIASTVFLKNNPYTLLNMTIDIDEDKLKEMDSYGRLNALEQKDVREAFQLYIKTKALLKYSNVNQFNVEVTSNPTEKFLSDFLMEKEFGFNIGLRDIIARMIAVRIMKRRYESLSDVAKQQRSFYDFLSPQDPFLHNLGNKVTDRYLDLLDNLDARHGRIELPDVTKSNIREKRRTAIMDSKNALRYFSLFREVDEFMAQRDSEETIRIKIAANHPGLPIASTTHEKSTLDVLPLESISRSPQVRTYLSKNKASIKTLKYHEHSLGQAAIHAKRTGYSQNGLFELDIFDPQRNQLISLKLSEAEFDHYVKTAEVPSVRVEEWKISSREDDVHESTPAIQFPFRPFVGPTRADGATDTLSTQLVPLQSTSDEDMAMVVDGQPALKLENKNAKDDLGGIDFKRIHVEKSGESEVADINTTSLENSFKIEGLVPVFLRSHALANWKVFLRNSN